MEQKMKTELDSEESDDLDGLNIRDIDIEYQEDDGNSNCDDGGCTI